MAPQVTVLIADDQPRARQALRALLATWPPALVVCEVENGARAAEAAQQRPVDVALLDVRMPVLTGIEAARLIKAACPATRVIVLSIYGDYEEQALAAGADAFLNKTDVPRQLLPLVARLVGIAS